MGTRISLGTKLAASAAVFLTAVFLLARPTSSALASPIRVYVFAGQSNMVGKDTASADLVRFAPAAAAGTPGVLFWGPIADFPTTWAPLRAPTEVLQPTQHHGFGPEIGAATLLVKRHPKDTIAIVKFARGGTNLYRDWNPARAGGLYDQMIQRVNAAVEALRRTKQAPVVLAGFFWMQGESDSVHRVGAEAYRRNLSSFVKTVRRDLHAPRLPFVFGRISDLRREMPKHFKFSDVVREAQDEVAQSVPNAYMVSTDGLEHAPSKLHFSSRGTYDLGRRFVEPSFPL